MGIKEDVMKLGYHQASCLSCIKILEIIFKEMTKNDRFVLSKAHASPVLYYCLAEKGIIDKSIIPDLPSHCEYGLPGVEFTGGSLGMGLGVACGIALSKKYKKETGTVYCLVGDGELYEGSNWEAIMFASAHKLNNLVCIVDRNGMSASGWTEDFLPLESLKEKFKSFGWKNINDFNKNTFPSFIIRYTIKGEGYKEFEGNPLCHTMKI